MAWYRAGGGGIPASLKTGMNDVLNKKFGTSTTYAPAGWPDNVNLLGKLPEKTVSGAIAHLTDGADEVPIKSWGVTLGASLDGVSSLTCKQAGKNLLNPSLLSLFSSNKYIGTANYNSEGTIDIIGGSNYVISFAFTITDGRVRYWDAEGNQISNVSLSNKQSLALTVPSNAVKMSFYAGQNTAQTSVTDFEPMLEVGNTATAYAPYVAPTTATVSLGRTIYGGQVDVVQGTGTDENGNDFTFTPISPTPETKLGVNNFWSDGDSQVTYRRDIDLALGGG